MSTAVPSDRDPGPAGVCFPVWGGTAVAMVTDAARAARAEELLRQEVSAIDRACSRFRSDSEIRELTHRASGTATKVGPLLGEALDAAVRAAELTDGLVDPTVGRALVELGYDRDFADLAPDGPAGTPAPAPGWWRLGWDPASRTIVVPRGVELDLGATAKALAADRAAAAISAELGCGVLVNLAGDVAVAGPAPVGGWRIAVEDDHQCQNQDAPAVAITAGAVATSGITRRRWLSGGVCRHHIVDPRTGSSAEEVWRTVSVVAGSCVDANTASTAAIVLGAPAPRWLADRGLPARLVSVDGTVHTVAGWPVDLRTVAA